MRPHQRYQPPAPRALHEKSPITCRRCSRSTFHARPSGGALRAPSQRPSVLELTVARLLSALRKQLSQACTPSGLEDALRKGLTAGRKDRGRRHLVDYLRDQLGVGPRPSGNTEVNAKPGPIDINFARKFVARGNSVAAAAFASPSRITKPVVFGCRTRGPSKNRSSRPGPHPFFLRASPRLCSYEHQ